MLGRKSIALLAHLEAALERSSTDDVQRVTFDAEAIDHKTTTSSGDTDQDEVDCSDLWRMFLVIGTTAVGY